MGVSSNLTVVIFYGLITRFLDFLAWHDHLRGVSRSILIVGPSEAACLIRQSCRWGAQSAVTRCHDHLHRFVGHDATPMALHKPHWQSVTHPHPALEVNKDTAGYSLNEG